MTCERCFTDEGGPCLCDTYCGSILCDKFPQGMTPVVYTASIPNRKD